MSIIYVNNKDYDLHSFLQLSSAEDHIISLKKIIYDWFSKDHFTLKTSGSTGQPKDFSFSKEQLIFSANQTISFFELKEHDNLHLCLSPEHTAGFMMVIRALVGNMNLVVEKPSSDPSFVPNLKIDFSAFVPFQVENLLSDPLKVNTLNDMKSFIIGGGTVSDRLISRLHPVRTSVYNTFGMTETLTHIAVRRLNPDPDPYFSVLPNVSIKTDESGRLIINSPVTNHLDLLTNDLVELLSDKEFKWKGRLDNVVNSGGVKLLIEDVENKIKNILQYDSLFLFKTPDEKFGEKLHLVIEGNHAEEELFCLFNTFLEKFEIPKKIFIVKEIDRTKLGKFDKKLTLDKLGLNT